MTDRGVGGGVDLSHPSSQLTLILWSSCFHFSACGLIFSRQPASLFRCLKQEYLCNECEIVEVGSVSPVFVREHPGKPEGHAFGIGLTAWT